VSEGGAIQAYYRLAAQRLAGLDLPAMFTIAELRTAVERVRGRPVRLIAKELPVLAPHGLWIAGEHADYVFFDRAAGPIRQYQIIGHELGHMLFDDDAVPACPAELAAVIAPQPAVELVHVLGQRTGYTDPVERRAEAFGTVAIQRMDLWTAPAGGTPDEQAMLARLAAALVPGEPPC
jgi:hypothetical protein